MAMHQHIHSTEHADKRQAIYYPPTGTGRDTYIMTNNGGTNIKHKLQGVPELGNFMKFGPLNKTVKPASFGKFQKYASDGTGRDQYVVSKHGGQVNEFAQTGKLLLNFRETLRDGGLSHNYQVLQKTRTVKRNPTLSFYQGSETKRLSQPKRKTDKFENIVEEFRHSNRKASLV